MVIQVVASLDLENLVTDHALLMGTEAMVVGGIVLVLLVFMEEEFQDQ